MLYFIDCHPEYQKSLRFREVMKEGYEAAVVKVSEGTSFVPGGLKSYVRRIKGVNFISRAGERILRKPERQITIGYYHFLTNADGDRQAAHFMRTVKSLGGHANRLLVVDFEANGPSPERTATNAALKAFVRGVKRRTGGHPVILYSGYGFWTSGDNSGPAEDYNVDATWDARYADMNRHDNPRQYWDSVKSWYWNQAKWGSMKPKMVQFTSAGRVASIYMDVNIFDGSKTELLKLAAKNTYHRPADGGGDGDGNPKPQPSPERSNKDKAIEYGLKLRGAPYSWWFNEQQGLGEGAPAWAVDARAPRPARVRNNGLFCAAVGNLMRRSIGKTVPKNGMYDGGTGAWWLNFTHVHFDLGKLEKGDVLFRRYRDTKDQGHFAVAMGGANDKILQSYPDGGCDTRWTARESHSGGYYESIIKAKEWLGS